MLAADQKRDAKGGEGQELREGKRAEERRVLPEQEHRGDAEHDAGARSLLDQIAEPLRVAARADALVLGPAEHPSGVRGITVGIAV